MGEEHSPSAETVEALRAEIAELRAERDTTLRRIGDVAPVFLIELDRRGHVRWLNRFFEEATGWRLETIRGQDGMELFVPEEERAGHREAFRAALDDDGTPHTGTLLDARGGRRQVDWRRTSVRTNGHTDQSLLIVGRPHDGAEELREQLASRDAALHAFARTMEEVLWIADVLGDRFVYRYLSPGYARYSHLPVEAYYEDGLVMFEHVHPDDRPLLTDVLGGIVSGELRGRSELEYRMTCPDGQVRWVRSMLTIVPIHGGVRLLGMTLDVTERRRMAEALEASRDQLEARVRERTAELEAANEALRSEARVRAAAEERAERARGHLKTILDQLFAFVGVMDAEGRLEYVNEAALAAGGLAPEKVAGVRLWEAPWFEAYPESVAHLKDAVVGATSGEKLRVDARADTVDGPIWIDIGFSPLLTEDGRVDAIIGCAVDITARREAEAEARRSMHERGVLLREVHHRVKNNLQVVSSLLSLQAGRLPEGDPAKRPLEETRQRVHAIASLHETLHGARELGRVALDRYLEHVLGDLQRLAHDRRDVRFELELEAVEVPLDGAVPLGLIVTELAMNALEHAFPEGRGTVRVALRGGEEVEITVADDGAGFAAPLGATASGTDGPGTDGSEAGGSGAGGS
ncbi:MAG TPA: PAS domain S-box protein, partial [Polyangiaceae bacterium LLY-WYZ-15_(1-7)]|nr:PAS domain S-box protein [Polyangiaceae bacterium LLY-WYZ-15_(1-7)]